MKQQAIRRTSAQPINLRDYVYRRRDTYRPRAARELSFWRDWLPVVALLGVFWGLVLATALASAPKIAAWMGW